MAQLKNLNLKRAQNVFGNVIEGFFETMWSEGSSMEYEEIGFVKRLEKPNGIQP